MKKLPLIILILMVLTSCKSDSETTPTPNEENLSFLALGDSYTIGESVDPSRRWPVQLVDSLRSRGISIEYPEIIATTGWTTRNLLTAMDEQLENEQYDLVSVLIGVNNQYQGKSIEEYETELRDIFERAVSLSKSGSEGVFALTIPDYGATPFGASSAEEIGREIEKFNSVFKEVASEFNIETYDITPISLQAKENASLVATDGLHPSAEMYSLWVEEIVDEVEEKISSQN